MRIRKNESIDLDLPALKTHANKLLPAGDSATFSIDADGKLMMEIYDGDVMVMSFSMNGINQETAMKRITHKLKEFENG